MADKFFKNLLIESLQGTLSRLEQEIATKLDMAEELRERIRLYKAKEEESSI